MALQQQLANFADRGYVVVPGVLSVDQVLEARHLLETHRAVHTEQSWASPPGEPGGEIGALYGPDGEAGRWACRRLFEADESLDELVHALLTAEPVAELVRQIVGEDLCLRNAWAMWRMPVHEPPPPPEERAEGSAWPRESGIHYQMWHREEGGICLPEHPLFVHSLQVKVELDGCDSGSHCITTVPESLAEKQRLALTPSFAQRRDPKRHRLFGLEQQAAKPFDYWQNNQILPGAVDICCRPGDAIVFNNHNYHAGTVRQTQRHRRSIGFDYGHAELTPPEHAAECFEPRVIERYPALLRQYSRNWQGRGTAKM
jgi:ectoine hydroxylase-related dioxygenase (phytanoyl-CoA dioxygenase family)